MMYNLQINAMAAVMITLILLGSRYGRVYLPENSVFRHLSLHLLILLVLDCAMWIVNLRHFPGARLLNLTVNYAYYAEQLILGYLWGLYSHQLAQIKLPAIGRALHRVPLVLGILLLICNPMTQSVFVISPDNIYSRGWGIWGTIYAICAFLYLIEAMLWAVCRLFRSSLQERRDGLNLLISSSLPVLGAILQMLFYGISTIWSLGAVGLLILYLNVQTRHAAQAEEELSQSRISIMLSQIQPHFLYNSLVGIKQLCDDDPQKASDALEHFSYYLRGNLDSLANTDLIPFSKELEHVTDYLYLEKMRYEERVTILWEIMEQDFMLPPLTLQSIVENGIRYGITKKDRGGTMTIRSERAGSSIVITVADDGIGFDTDKPVKDGRSHIGIENVKSRLEMMCGGTLNIRSEAGAGTTVSIILPLREEGTNENHGGRRRTSGN